MIYCKNCLNFKQVPLSKLTDRFLKIKTRKSPLCMVASCSEGKHWHEKYGEPKKSVVLYNKYGNPTILQNEPKILVWEKCNDFINMDD